ncbi:hypothetical protein D3C84_992970 [compost metagenome]
MSATLLIGRVTPEAVSQISSKPMRPAMIATTMALIVPLCWASSSTACSLTESASNTCLGRSITTPQALESAIGLTG